MCYLKKRHKCKFVPRLLSMIAVIPDQICSVGFSMSSASGSNVSSSAGSTASSGTTSVYTGSSVTPGLIGTMARLLHNVVFLSPGHIITALNKVEILNSLIE